MVAFDDVDVEGRLFSDFSASGDEAGPVDDGAEADSGLGCLSLSRGASSASMGAVLTTGTTASLALFGFCGCGGGRVLFVTGSFFYFCFGVVGRVVSCQRVDRVIRNRRRGHGPCAAVNGGVGSWDDGHGVGDASKANTAGAPNAPVDAWSRRPPIERVVTASCPVHHTNAAGATVATTALKVGHDEKEIPASDPKKENPRQKLDAGEDRDLASVGSILSEHLLHTSTLNHDDKMRRQDIWTGDFSDGIDRTSWSIKDMSREENATRIHPWSRGAVEPWINPSS